MNLRERFVGGVLWPGLEAAEGHETSRDTVPVGRVGHPAEIAQVVRTIASDSASFISGVSYPVDGGFEAMTPLAHPLYRKLV